MRFTGSIPVSGFYRKKLSLIWSCIAMKVSFKARTMQGEGIKIIQGKLEHNKKRFPIPGAFLQHVFGDLIPLICCKAVKII